ncbi:MAG: STAS domain-containing protein [Acidimicrobiia bacterium]|nr:STAS domain-containing protein [Acidimicrobiia bacterium]
MLLEIEEEKHASGVTIVRLKGRLTLGREIQRLEDHLRQARDGGTDKVVLDLAGVDFVDSSGLGMLTQSFSTFNNSGGGFCLAAVTTRVEQILKLTRLDTILPSAASVDEAVVKLTAP